MEQTKTARAVSSIVSKFILSNGQKVHEDLWQRAAGNAWMGWRGLEAGNQPWEEREAAEDASGSFHIHHLAFIQLWTTNLCFHEASKSSVGSVLVPSPWGSPCLLPTADFSDLSSSLRWPWSWGRLPGNEREEACPF